MGLSISNINSCIIFCNILPPFYSKSITSHTTEIFQKQVLLFKCLFSLLSHQSYKLVVLFQTSVLFTDHSELHRSILRLLKVVTSNVNSRLLCNNNMTIFANYVWLINSCMVKYDRFPYRYVISHQYMHGTVPSAVLCGIPPFLYFCKSSLWTAYAHLDYTGLQADYSPERWTLLIWLRINTYEICLE